MIDLGGGLLRSEGRNCFLDGTIYDLEATDTNVTAKYNWWGSPSGPLPGTVHESQPGYTVDYFPALYRHQKPVSNAL